MTGITTQINDFTNNKFIVRFSNIVNMTNYELDTHILDNYVKNVSVPDFSIPMLDSRYLHERQLHPNPIGARDLQTMNIEFMLDENMQNYYLFYCWIYWMRFGEACGKTNLKGDELLRMDCIDAIELISLNNNNKIISKMKFKHAIPNNLAQLSLQYGSAENVTYVVTFEYEQIELQLENKEDLTESIDRTIQ